jgi:hypothetical protein
MTPEEKAKRMEDLKKKRESVENELTAMETELSDEILAKKLGDLTVKEFLEVIGETNAMPIGGDMAEMMKASMDMLTKNPAMAKNLMKMFTGQRY